METLQEPPETGKPFMSRLSSDDIIIDWDIYPRVKIDNFTEEKYCNDLIKGISFPYPKVEQIGKGTYRVTDGVHTVTAHKRRRDMYRLRDAGQHIGDPLPDISEEELDTMLCWIEEIAQDEDRMLHSARHNRKNGKALTSDDYKKVARHLYSKWFGAPVTKVAGELGIRWETVDGYIADMVADYDRQRAELILQIDAEGRTQEEISRLGREKYPHGTGWSQESMSKFLGEHRKSARRGTEKGTGKVLNFRGSYKDPKTVDSMDGREQAVERTSESSEKQKKEKNRLNIIPCPDSVMVDGLNHLHEEIRNPYLKDLKSLNAITWEKELQLRESLGEASH